MDEFWVTLPLLVLGAYFFAKSLLVPLGNISGIYWLCGSFGCLVATFPLTKMAHGEHYSTDPNALQNAHTAIIGKLRAELDECREEK